MYLQSDRLQLRAPELSDLDFLFHIENDTRQWIVSACKTPYSRYQLQQYIETNSHDIYVDKQMRLMVELRDTCQLVGTIDLFDYNPSARRAEVGQIIDAPYRGKGYAKEALLLTCEYAEHVLDLHQLYAYIHTDNVVARQLYLRCGFREVAILDDWTFSDRKFRSVVLYQRFFEK